MPEIAYVNGEFMPLENAFVHVEDRGYQFADAAYEAVRTYNGKPFAIGEHLSRLYRSLGAIQINLSIAEDNLREVIYEAIRRAGFKESMIYLQVSRGRAPRHRRFPAKATPTVVLTVREFVDHPEWREIGITAITVPDIRWGRCDIKSVGLLANCLAYQAAQQAGADDAIFITEAGVVTEATAANVFIVRGSELLTPPNSSDLLPGITRVKILQAGAAAGLHVSEQAVLRTDLLAADEVFLSSTSAEVAPVVAIDRKKIGAGKPGPASASIYRRFISLFTKE